MKPYIKSIFVIFCLAVPLSGVSSAQKVTKYDRVHALLEYEDAFCCEVIQKRAETLFGEFDSLEDFTKTMMPYISGSEKRRTEEMFLYRALGMLSALDAQDVKTQKFFAQESLRKTILEVAENHTDYETKMRAMVLIQKHRFPSAFKVLIANTEHEEPRVRAQAIRILGKYGNSVPKSVLKALDDCLEDEESYQTNIKGPFRYVLEDLLEAYQKIGKGTKETPKILRRLAKEKKHYCSGLSFEIARTAAIIAPKSWGLNFLQKKLLNRKERVQIHAVNAIYGLKNDKYDSVELLETALQKTDSDLLKQTIRMSLLKSKLSEESCLTYAKAFLDDFIEKIKEPPQGSFFSDFVSIDLRESTILAEYQQEHAEKLVPIFETFVNELESLSKISQNGIYSFDVKEAKEILDKLRDTIKR